TKNLAIADLAAVAGAAASDDRVVRPFNEGVVHGDLQFNLAKQVHRDLTAAVDLSLPYLPAECFDVHDRQADDFDFREGGFHVFQLAGLDYCDDQLHGGGELFVGRWEDEWAKRPFRLVSMVKDRPSVEHPKRPTSGDRIGLVA